MFTVSNMDKLDVCRKNLISYDKSAFDKEFSGYHDHRLGGEVASVIRRHLSVSKKAAVLIPLFIKNGEIHILLTQRSHNVGSYKGHISFLGGKESKQDSSIVETALREAHEEVGLDRKYVDVISTWNPSLIGGKVVDLKLKYLLVYPVIVVLKPGFKVHAESSEVSQVFDVPLEFFLSSKCHKYGNGINPNKKRYYYHVFQCNGKQLDILDQPKQNSNYIIWGYTAGLCVRSAVVVYGRLPLFKLVIEFEKKVLEGYINYISGSSMFKNNSKL